MTSLRFRFFPSPPGMTPDGCLIVRMNDSCSVCPIHGIRFLEFCVIPLPRPLEQNKGPQLLMGISIPLCLPRFLHSGSSSKLSFFYIYTHQCLCLLVCVPVWVCALFFAEFSRLHSYGRIRPIPHGLEISARPFYRSVSVLYIYLIGITTTRQCWPAGLTSSV
jgi:hypothetical protein